MSPIQQLFLSTGAILAFLSVAAGSFGAHLFKQWLSQDQLMVFETAVRYQMYHALALMVLSQTLHFFSSYWLIAAGGCFLVGTIIFSGSLYALVFSGNKAWGMVTPIGGTLFLLGWFFIFLSSFF